VLADALLWVSPQKLNLFCVCYSALGHYFDERGIHADATKVERIRTWPTPASYNDVQKFLGLVEYIAKFLPHLSDYTGVLSGMCSDGLPFIWRPVHPKPFKAIKATAGQKLVLRPIDRTAPVTIWVVVDACPSGCGAYYGQGISWKDMQPSGFMSRKFSKAQRNYFVYELESLGVLEALQKWQDKLIGIPFTVVTDHKAMLSFQ
jgi:hypothetical protein